MMPRTCQAHRENDQMCCGRCGLQWDINDPEPPRCTDDLELIEQRRENGREHLNRIKALLSRDKSQ